MPTNDGYFQTFESSFTFNYADPMDRTYHLLILTDKLANNDEGVRIGTEISRLVYDFMENNNSDL